MLEISLKTYAPTLGRQRPQVRILSGAPLLRFHIGQAIEFQRFLKRDDWSDDHVANQRCPLRLFQGRYFLLHKTSSQRSTRPLKVSTHSSVFTHEVPKSGTNRINELGGKIR
ncbi:MAG: hypothetical protein CBB68_15700 [Rhodospirillaceae bacterium TMED8]|nr:MAG: hypothetical protein CBB68_15700 [Rhodospirillaceae bacterium TMED8]